VPPGLGPDRFEVPEVDLSILPRLVEDAAGRSSREVDVIHAAVAARCGTRSTGPS
jgi:hypothetical protein